MAKWVRLKVEDFTHSTAFRPTVIQTVYYRYTCSEGEPNDKIEFVPTKHEPLQIRSKHKMPRVTMAQYLTSGLLLHRGADDILYTYLINKKLLCTNTASYIHSYPFVLVCSSGIKFFGKSLP